jgi:hypothetical protein
MPLFVQSAPLVGLSSTIQWLTVLQGQGGKRPKASKIRRHVWCHALVSKSGSSWSFLSEHEPLPATSPMASLGERIKTRGAHMVLVFMVFICLNTIRLKLLKSAFKDKNMLLKPENRTPFTGDMYACMLRLMKAPTSSQNSCFRSRSHGCV